MYCSRCAERLVENANYCHHCGVRVGGDAHDRLDQRPFEATGNGRTGDMPDPDSLGLEPGLAPSTGDGEQEVWSGCYSPKGMAGSFAVVVAGTAAALIGMLITAFTGPNWLLVTLILAIPPVWLVQIVRVAKRCLSAQYRLTNRRLFLQIGFINRHKDQLDLARIEDVRIQQNVLHRFFDVGSIEILSTDRRLRRVVMEGIEGADEVAETIRTLSRRVQPKPDSAVPSVRG